MNILSLELEYTSVFHILPHALITLGKSVYVYVNWLNFEFCVKHISTDFTAKGIQLYSPSVTIRQYPLSGYKYSLEVYLFGLTYRKGLLKRQGKGIKPYDNTNGFVTRAWFDQFKGKNDTAFDILKGIDDMVKKIKEMIEKDNENKSKK